MLQLFRSILLLLHFTFSKDIDASGKPGSGIAQGNIWWMGSYEQCLSINEAHFCSMTNVAISLGKKTVT